MSSSLTQTLQLRFWLAVLSFFLLTGVVPVFAQVVPRTIDTVAVTGTVSSRADASAREAQSVTTITAADIARTAARSLADVLALAPGVDILARSPASADIALRGASTEGVVILVNGIRMSDQQSGHFDLDLAVPLDAIERIEVLRGVHSALYGANAVGGVINIVTRNHAANSGLASLDLGGGSFGTASAAARGGGTLLATHLSGAVDWSRSDGHRSGTDFRTLQVSGSADRALGTGTLRLDAGVGARDFGAADFYGPYPSFEDTHVTTAAAQWNGAVGTAWSLSLDADTRRHGDLFTLVRDNPALYQNHHVTWQSGGRIVARRTVSDILAIAFGGDADELRLTSARLGDHQLERSGVFSEAVLGRSGGALVDAALRIDRSPAEGTIASPSVAVSLPVTGSLALRGSAATGYRAPTWTERYYSDPANIGNPDLRTEHFRDAEAGVRFTPSAGVSIDATGFLRDARDVIDWTKPSVASDSVPWRTMNVGRVNNRGVEAEARMHDILGGGDWNLRATGLSFNARSASGLKGKYALNPVTGSFGVSTTYPLLSARIAADASVLHRANEGLHTMVNMRILLPSPHDRSVTLTLDVMNLTNESWFDVSGAPVAGRSAYLAFRWLRR
jgi:iron complex outermembrane receptor protein